MIAIGEAWKAGLLGREHWLRNMVSGVIVGVVALPLAMAFAIASGVKPEQGIYTAIIGGLLAGAGLLMLVRHRASLGGLGVMAIYLQKKRGWSAGTLQMIADGFIVCGALTIVDPLRVGLSILGALVLNMVLAINHRPGRYFG